MTPEQAFKIISDDSEAFACGITDLVDRKDYISDLYRPGNSAELYLAQQTLLMAYQSLLKGTGVQDGKSQDYPRAS